MKDRVRVLAQMFHDHIIRIRGTHGGEGAEYIIENTALAADGLHDPLHTLDLFRKIRMILRKRLYLEPVLGLADLLAEGISKEAIRHDL